MPLINCPECNREISDKVKACPHCGYPFETASSSIPEPQQVEITSVNIKPKNPKKVRLIIISVIGVIVLIAVALAAVYIIDTNNKKAAEDLAFNGYIDNLNLASLSMLAGGGEAESLCNLTSKVWYNTIYKKSDSATDKFTKHNPTVFFDDFNLALDKLFTDSSTLKTISFIKENQRSVQEIMKELQNPPKGFEVCYGTVTNLYTAYQGLTDLAISPKGNYTTYTQNKNNKVDEFMANLDKLKTQIPEKRTK